MTAHAITGSNLGTNFFRIDGPDIGGPGVNTIQTTLFTLQGRVATNAGVSPTSVTYTRTSTTGGVIDAFATSEPDQVVQVTAPASAPPSSRRASSAATSPGSPTPERTHRLRCRSPTHRTDHRRQ